MHGGPSTAIKGTLTMAQATTPYGTLTVAQATTLTGAAMLSSTVVATACKNWAQCEAALRVLRKMPQLGPLPNVISFNAGIIACERNAPTEACFEACYGRCCS
jgi:hypothetical protein